MNSKMWQTVSNRLKNLRVFPSLQSRSPLLGVQAASRASEKPKRPLPPYFRFLAKVRADVAIQNPTLKTKDLVKLIGQKWAKLDDASKEHYTAAFKEEMIPYTSQLTQYYETLPPEVREKQEQFKLEKQVKSEKRERRKRLENLGKPKKPATPYLQYVKSMFSVAPNQGRDGATEQMKLLSTKWKSISQTEKAPFVAKYQKEAEDYKLSLLKWEDAMLKQGNLDVVRHDRLPGATKKSKTKGDLVGPPDGKA